MRTLLTLLLLLLMPLSAIAADVSQQKARIDGLAGQITAIEQMIDDKASDDTGLLKLRIDLDSFTKSLIDLGVH